MKKESIDWSKAFDQIPASYSAKLGQTLNELKEEPEMRRKIPHAALVAALILFIACTAFAATRYDLIDYFTEMTGLVPDKTAQSTVSHDLASMQNDNAIIKVREAVYDGKVLRILISAEAVDPEHNVITDSSAFDGVDFGTESTEEYITHTGKTLCDIGYLDVSVEGINIISETIYYSRESEDLIIYKELRLEEEGNDNIKVYAGIVMDENTISQMCFNITKSEHCITMFNVEGNTSSNHVTIIGASYEVTPFADYLTIRYIPKDNSETEFTGLPDNSINYYATPNGKYYHIVSDCCGMANADIISFDEACASGKLECPICIGISPFSGRLWGLRISSKEWPCTIVWDGTEVYGEGNNKFDISCSESVAGLYERQITFILQSDMLEQSEMMLTVFDTNGGEEAVFTLIPEE